MGDEMLEFNGEVKEVSQNACLINVDGVTGWVPDSLADYVDEPEVGKEIVFFIPEWLAEKKGFLDED
ncbi:MAG: hypothetical protein P9L97_06205 [Candidatus Tenebribacter davisii]|nr:hypothetical protein [Candidatus Tenebribacter davisii]